MRAADHVYRWPVDEYRGCWQHGDLCHSCTYSPLFSQFTRILGEDKRGRWKFMISYCLIRQGLSFFQLHSFFVVAKWTMSTPQSETHENFALQSSISSHFTCHWPWKSPLLQAHLEFFWIRSGTYLQPYAPGRVEVLLFFSSVCTIMETLYLFTDFANEPLGDDTKKTTSA